MMVTLWAIAVVERGYEGGEGPIQEDLGRIEDLEAGRGGVVVGTSKRESMVCFWCLIVSLAMRLAAGLATVQCFERSYFGAKSQLKRSTGLSGVYDVAM